MMLLYLSKSFAVLMLLATPAWTHYITLKNSCKGLKVSGQVGDARWRGRIEPLSTGSRMDTDGDSTAVISTNFG